MHQTKNENLIGELWFIYGKLMFFWVTLNRLRAGLKTFLMISSRNSLKTPSWSIPASSTPRSFTNFTRMTPFIEFTGNLRSWSYPSFRQGNQSVIIGCKRDTPSFVGNRKNTNCLSTSSIRERRMVMWVTCGEAELVSTNPKLSFSFVTMFLNSSTLWKESVS